MRQATEEVQLALNPSEDFLRGHEDLKISEADYDD